MASPGTSLRLLAAALALLAGPAGAQTTDQLRREVASVGVDELLGARVVRDGLLTEAEGRPFRLADLAGKPVLLSFNYTSCPKLCGLQVAGLARALKDAGWDGGGFEVVTVSVDPEEKLPQLQKLKAARVRDAGGGAIERSWHFAKGSKADVEALARSVGFKYRYEPSTGEYVHQATLIVLTGDGRVSGYLHGISYRKEALHAALDRAGGDRVATAAEQKGIGGFLLTCIGVDPSGKAPLALVLMRTGAVAVFLFLAVFLGRNLLRERRTHGTRT